MEGMEEKNTRTSENGLLPILQDKDEEGSSGNGGERVLKSFNKIKLDIETKLDIKTKLYIKINSFKECSDFRSETSSKSICFENIAKGREGAILVDYKDNAIPIVRTTTVYNKPVQRFLPFHYDILNKVKEHYKGIGFNNAMIEIYDSRYRTMGYHTDQALDLREDSYICLFSCYENPETKPEDVRKLKVKNKSTDECTEVLLENNTAVLFSTETNKEHLHKIVLDSDNSSNKWLGITFRFSKTSVLFIQDIPYKIKWDYKSICFMKILRMANDEERKEFYKHKKNENLSIGYDYPDIDYTISPSDMMPIQ